ncbi:MAG: class I SAM-dependent methyltransferase [Candidatus Pacebacteria bacterium]|nr:class I SAM-dependent methyltransferase [Candidatus Paceibacterota bacterium]
MKDYKSRTIESYNKNAKAMANKFKDMTDLQRRKEFGRFIELLKGNKILDLGCGAGEHSLYFKNQGLDIVSVDLSESMIDLCKEKDLDARVMDIENLQFEENTFDGIWSVTSLLHIPKSNIEKVVKKLSDILRKDGVLYICVKEGEGEDFVEDKEDYKNKNGSTARFFSFWQEDELIEVFTEGFDVIEKQKVKLGNTIFLQIFFRKK